MRFQFVIGLLVIMLLAACRGDREKSISFNQQVRPILNKKCLGCHGGVKQSGGFSLLFEEEALAVNESGKPAIVPGRPGRSELIARINHEDPELRMPQDAEPLTAAEKKLITRWIREGAKWEAPWALMRPKPVNPPALPDDLAEIAKNELDQFIMYRLQQNDLQPNQQADCSTLLRRLSLDLTGLPPSAAQVADFCHDPSESRYQAYIDRFLASPRYGERWAALWMDLARYADTKGYERDPHREIWRYRDWLIRAFNRDMPFDQFTIEQLAGDLLTDPTPDQYIATAFHRNTMTNDEGGTDNEEFRIAAVIDRVNTTWQVWQGLTFGCVQCHSHPYDPFRHEEYYRFFDFFNQSADADIFAETPNYKFFSAQDSVNIDAIKAWVEAKAPADFRAPARYFNNLIRITEPKIHGHYLDSLTNGALADTKFLVFYNGGYAIIRNLNLSRFDRMLVNFQGAGKGGTLTFHVDEQNGAIAGQLEVNDKTRGYHLVELDQSKVTGKHDLYVSFRNPAAAEARISINWLVPFRSLPGKGEERYREMETKLLDLLNTSTEKLPVMIENEQDFSRQTRVFNRGSWLDPGEPVVADVPASMPALPAGKKDRMALAKWLVSPENPLTARVMVSRIWQQLFGLGLVETLEDFGTQGLPPSHPQLLDWLALHFQQEQDWSLKALLRLIVSSHTYRQASEAGTLSLKKDPRNRLLSRGPRLRLTAEQIRDQALAVSGLLSDKMYGKSVMPPQPDGVWQVVYNGHQWQTSEGEDRYRRAIYTYTRRTSPYPSFLTFDGPSREVCTSRRIRTNTPLQALVTLNDPVYLEAAMYLAQRAMKETKDLERNIDFLYEQAMMVTPEQKVTTELRKVYEDSRQYYQRNEAAVQALLSNVAFEPGCAGEDCVRLAALTAVGNTIMNLDGFLVK